MEILVSPEEFDAEEYLCFPPYIETFLVSYSYLFFIIGLKD